jgi:trans-2,3-dihydro-3-hydroxyanthranilate isomerase
LTVYWVGGILAIALEFSYHIVDVFTDKPLEGNALAVVTDASALDGAAMQRVAREFNLSETSFILPSLSRNGAPRIRIFTPYNEMEFAGHPTLGTAYVARKLELVPRDAASFALEENVGLVGVRVDEGADPLLWLTTPPIRSLASAPRDACARALSLDENELLPEVPCETLSAGNPTLFIALRDEAAVDRARLDESAARSILRGPNAGACVFAFAPATNGAYSRMFAPHLGVPEDPATGSATGPLAAFMMKHGLARGDDGTRFVSEQGTKMGRRSLLHVLVHGTGGSEGIEVGGRVTPVAEGAFKF